MNDLPEQVAVQSAKQMRELMKRKKWNNSGVDPEYLSAHLFCCDVQFNQQHPSVPLSKKWKNIVYLLFLEISCEENCGTMRHCSDCRGGISVLSRFIRICFVVICFLISAVAPCGAILNQIDVHSCFFIIFFQLFFLFSLFFPYFFPYCFPVFFLIFAIVFSQVSPLFSSLRSSLVVSSHSSNIALSPLLSAPFSRCCHPCFLPPFSPYVPAYFLPCVYPWVFPFVLFGFFPIFALCSSLLLLACSSACYFLPYVLPYGVSYAIPCCLLCSLRFFQTWSSSSTSEKS